ncbi:hypothetical protein Fmac_026840 [Flemingia macrophylla]|uniref:PB1 domain-containing protein n=1 Tax=Flemingia macrophylla TaxID=520843 RepID=A0ABD1LG78_9FABA
MSFVMSVSNGIGDLLESFPENIRMETKLSGEELDMLISVTNDDDLNHMMHEYNRLYCPNSKPVRMQLFLFDQPDATKPPHSNSDFLFDLDNHVVPLPPYTSSFAAINFHHPLPDSVAPISIPNPNVHRHLHQEMHCLQIAHTKYRN